MCYVNVFLFDNHIIYSIYSISQIFRILPHSVAPFCKVHQLAKLLADGQRFGADEVRFGAGFVSKQKGPCFMKLEVAEVFYFTQTQYMLHFLTHSSWRKMTIFLWLTERLQDLLEEADELHERTDYRQPLGGNSGKLTKTGWKMDLDRR